MRPATLNVAKRLLSRRETGLGGVQSLLVVAPLGLQAGDQFVDVVELAVDPLLRSLQRFELGVQGRQLIGHDCGLLGELLPFRSPGFDLLAQLNELRRPALQRSVPFRDASPVLGVIGFDLLEPKLLRFNLAAGVTRSAAEMSLLFSKSSEFGFELLQPRRLKLDGGFLADDGFAGCRVAAVDSPQAIVERRDLVIEGGFLGLDDLLAVRQLLKMPLGAGECRVDNGDLSGELPIVIPGEAQPPLFEVFADFAVLDGFGGLAAGGIELCLDLVDNVGQAEEVLGDAFEFALGIEPAGLEAADPRGLFEDQSAGRRIRLQDLIDAALLDNTVGGAAGAGAKKQILDVFESGRSARLSRYSASPLRQMRRPMWTSCASMGSRPDELS